MAAARPRLNGFLMANPPETPVRRVRSTCASGLEERSTRVLTTPRVQASGAAWTAVSCSATAVARWGT